MCRRDTCVTLGGGAGSYYGTVFLPSCLTKSQEYSVSNNTRLICSLLIAFERGGMNGKLTPLLFCVAEAARVKRLNPYVSVCGIRNG